MRFTRVAVLLVLFVVAGSPARADVVINEIFYHAPDDLDDLQFIELHNTGNKAVELAGWKFTRGVRFTFPAESKIEENGYLVVCKNQERFKKNYGFDAAGQFHGSLSHSDGRVELVDAAGMKIDGVSYHSRAPWPAAADGYSSSLERICPTARGDTPDNWAPSPLPTGPPKPGGTPGKQNSCYASHLPPVISKGKPLAEDVRRMYLAPYDSWQNRIAVLRFVQDIPLRPGDRCYDIVSEVEQGLPRLRHMPVLICWGEKDFVFDRHFLNEWTRRFPEAEVHSFVEAGHFVMEDVADKILALVADFLQRTAPLFPQNSPRYGEMPSKGYRSCSP